MNDVMTKYDVFVSYSHKDSDWVNNYLMPILNSWGSKIVLDEKSFLPGDPLGKEIGDFIALSTHVLFICTQGFHDSEWCGREIKTAIADDPGGLKGKAIPVVLEAGTVPDLISEMIWCNLATNQGDKDEWSKLCRAVGGTWTAETDRILAELFNISSFFGSYLSNSAELDILARSHGSQYRGVEEALSVETALGIAQIYALLAKIGKTDHIELVLSNDDGEINSDSVYDAITNGIILGGTSQAPDMLQRIAGRSIEFEFGRDMKDHLYVIDGSTRVPVQTSRDRFSFLIYKSSTSYRSNIIYLFSPWAIGSLLAARTLTEWYLQFARTEKDSEFLHVYEFDPIELKPAIAYRHQFLDRKEGHQANSSAFSKPEASRL